MHGAGFGEVAWGGIGVNWEKALRRQDPERTQTCGGNNAADLAPPPHDRDALRVGFGG